MSPALKTGRPAGRVTVAREGGRFRLSFRYHPDLVEEVRSLPGASFERRTKTWTCLVCSQSLRRLRDMWERGVLADDPGALVDPDEEIREAPASVIRRAAGGRPYQAECVLRDDRTFRALMSIPGARWDKTSRRVTYPPFSVSGLLDLKRRGVLSDPDGVLEDHAVTVVYDQSSGWFRVVGDPRAQAAFDRAFPSKDVVSEWSKRGIDAGLADPYSEEVYRGELARAAGAEAQPEGLLVDLYEYQRHTVAVALERTGFGIFHEMGLGKTACAVAVGHELCVNRGEVPRVMVVAPGSVKSQWRDEIERFTGCEDVAVVDGPADRRRDTYRAVLEDGFRWVVLNYDVLHIDLEELIPVAEGALLVADEAHRLKNHAAKRTRAMRKLGRVAARRLALTGTPIENHPGEWHSVASFLHPGILGDRRDFMPRYSYPGRFGGYEGARNLDELKDRSRTLYIRYRKQEAAPHLPPLRITHRVLDPPDDHAAALRRAHMDAADAIRRHRRAKEGHSHPDEPGPDDMTAVGMLKLMCLSPRLIHMSDAPAARALLESGLVPDEDGVKLDELRAICAEVAATGQRAVVFTSSTRMVSLVSERLSADGISHVVYTGEMSRSSRDEAVAYFQSEEGPTIFLSSDAGGEGLNLGRHCNLLINLDIPWTPGRLQQRAARIHRVDGAASSYLVVNLTLRGTVEDGIVRMLQRKGDMVGGVLGEGGAGPVTGWRAVEDLILELAS